MAICPHFVHVNLKLWTKMHEFYMNVSIEINWKTIAAGEIAVTSCILAKRIDKDNAKELLNTMITTTINKIGFKKICE